MSQTRCSTGGCCPMPQPKQPAKTAKAPSPKTGKTRAKVGTAKPPIAITDSTTKTPPEELLADPLPPPPPTPVVCFPSPPTGLGGLPYIDAAGNPQTLVGTETPDMYVRWNATTQAPYFSAI